MESERHKETGDPRFVTIRVVVEQNPPPRPQLPPEPKELTAYRQGIWTIVGVLFAAVILRILVELLLMLAR